MPCVGLEIVEEAAPFIGRMPLLVGTDEVVLGVVVDDESGAVLGRGMVADGGLCNGGLPGLAKPAPIGRGTLLASGGRLMAGRPIEVPAAVETPGLAVIPAEVVLELVIWGRMLLSVGLTTGRPALFAVTAGRPSTGLALTVAVGAGRAALLAKGGRPTPGLGDGRAVPPSDGPGEGED